MTEAPGQPKPPQAAPPIWRSVRTRLLLLALLPVVFLLPLLLGTAVKSWNDLLSKVLISQVSGQLTIAHQHLTGLEKSRGIAIQALAESAVFAKAQESGDIAPLLERERRKIGLDFLYYLRGVATLAASPKTARPLAPMHWPVVRDAVRGQARTSIDIYSTADLAALSPALARRARIPLVPTRAAAHTDRTVETRGMVLQAAARARDGVLVGGVLLNRNLGFIDEINDLVYPKGRLTEGSRGTATLFLDDVRVSTNVRLFAGRRALGTRVSVAVRDHVLRHGKVWQDRAFVVNDWYVSAYEPIIDSFGKRVGMLYVGFLEKPFVAARRATLFQIGGTVLAAILLFVPIMLWAARGIFRPLAEMNSVIQRVEAGNLDARTNYRGRDDEISRVAKQLDQLLDQVQERDRKLRDWANELETRVAERTAELQAANRQLEATTKQLIVSEKLAAIGEITAGIAHEINNPLAVIQGNFDVLRADLGKSPGDYSTECRLIQDQIQAIHILVSKLLQFARPEEYAETGEGHDADEVVRDTLPLVQHLLTSSGIKIDLLLAAEGGVAMNRTELQQVLVNLIVNAVQAMPKGGKLTIATSSPGQKDIEIVVSDTGLGMSDEVAARIFDPFFTTKRGEGTGLGLSICRNLITRAGGQITMKTTPGKGTRFCIILPRVG